MSFSPYTAEKYLDYPAVLAWCEALCAAMPEWFSLTVIGHSHQDRPIVLVTVGDRRNGANPERRPAVWLDGGTHAAEWAGVMATLFTLSQWAEQIQSGDDRFTRQTAHVLPCMSPDGFQAMCTGAPFIRSSLRTPMPGAAHRVGLQAQDVDGDGEALWMRWRHPSGAFVDCGDGRMRMRTLTDAPEDAWVVCTEGLFLEWDGHCWQQASLLHGQDLNRNFPGHWAPFGMFGMDAGPYPLSEPESRAAMDALAARPTVGVAVSNHTYTGAILTQPYRADTPLCDTDIRMMERLAEELVRDTGYRVCRVHPDFTYDPKQPIVGVWSDTLSTVFGLPAYTLELWNPFAWAGVEVDSPAEFFRKPSPEVVAGIVEKAMQEPGGWEPWRPFTHPQLGEVELGGLRHLRTVRNPPDRALFEECVRAFTVIERARAALPSLSVTVHTQSHQGTTIITAVVSSQGYLPTCALQRGRDVAQAAPVVLTLTPGDGVALRSARANQDVGHIEGWGSTHVGAASTPIYPGISADGPCRTARWVVEGTGSVDISWDGGRAGVGQQVVRI